MRRLLLALLLFVSPAYAGEIFRSWSATTTGAKAAVSLINQGVYTHTMIWSGGGTRTTCTVKLSYSEDNSTWSDLIAEQDCITNGSASATGYHNYIRVEVTGITGNGNTVYVAYDGITAGGSSVTVTGLTVDPAEGAAATGTNPAIIGGQATATEKTAVDTGDAARIVTDVNGRLVITPWAVPQLQGNKYTTTALNGTTGQELVAADATYKICLTSIMLYNADGTNSEAVSLLEGGQIGTGTVIGILPAPANGGVAISFPTPLCTSAVNKSVAADSAGSANPVYITVTYFKRIL